MEAKVKCGQQAGGQERQRRALELFRAGKTWRQIGVVVGVTAGAAYNLVLRARTAVCDHVPRSWADRRERVAVAIGGKRCERCGLRGPHECLRGDATARKVADEPSGGWRVAARSTGT